MLSSPLGRFSPVPDQKSDHGMAWVGQEKTNIPLCPVLYQVVLGTNDEPMRVFSHLIVYLDDFGKTQDTCF